MSSRPTNIKLAAGNDTLTIVWSDDHTSSYPYHYLRRRCPCATCTESGSTASLDPSPFPILGAKPLKPERADLVGHYALRIYWSDGHSTGIYAFDYLRELCPCPECKAKRGSEVDTSDKVA